MNRTWVRFCISLGLLGCLTACTRLPEPALPTLAPTKNAVIKAPTPTPPPLHTDLIVCLAHEPSSLYLYGDTSREADTILEAIYDGPTDILGFQAQPVILESLPTLANGSAKFESVSLRSGDIYVNPVTDQPQALANGSPYLPSGCTQQDCAQSFRGGAVEMDRLVADFTLKTGLTWSDGQPLTSADSVFSYSLDGDPATPSTKFLFDRTFSYTAIDERTAEWTGLPGFVDPNYQSNFWTPLPKHVFEGMTADEVRASDLAARTPIGWGPYQIDHWLVGEQVVLTPNLSYWNAADTKPFERVVFRFLGDQAGSAIDQVRTGECDILDETLLGPGDVPSLKAAQGEGDLGFDSIPGSLVMRLDMNLAPAGDAQTQPLFSEVGTRRGLAACTDRQTISDTVLNGTGAPADSYLPPSHPFYSPPAAPTPFDPSAGRQLLEAAGWEAGATPSDVRTAHGIPGIPDGTRLSFDVLTPIGDLYTALGDLLTSEWSQCGVEIHVKATNPTDLFASWPDGPVFGRTFEAVIWSWPSLITPGCDMFAGWDVPSDDNPYGGNASGFSDPMYDTACGNVLLGVPESTAYAQAVDRTQDILRDQVPAIPLFVRPRLVAYAPWLCGITMDSSSPSILWNIEALYACTPGT